MKWKLTKKTQIKKYFQNSTSVFKTLTFWLKSIVWLNIILKKTVILLIIVVKNIFLNLDDLNDKKDAYLYEFHIKTK